jgi:hypothetical protein
VRLANGRLAAIIHLRELIARTARHALIICLLFRKQ